METARVSARLTAIVLMVATAFWAAPAQGASSANASPENRWVQSTLAKMSVEEKVGQLFVANCFGVAVRDEDPAAVANTRSAYGVDTCEQVIEKYHLGGVFYFGSNYQNPLQLVGFSNGIQHVSTSQRVPVPGFISTDQEGGTVQVLGSPAALFPGNMGQGAIGDTGTAGDVANVLAQEMRAMGVDAGFAPVVDVNTNPLNQSDGARSFSDRSSVVQGYVGPQVRGFQRNKTAGVAATAKHFPGLGSVTTNTDVGPGASDRTLAQLQSIDLPPFKAAIKAGVKQVMTNFATYPNIDPSNLPAALSPMFVTDMLRNQLKFRGVIVTDDLGAGAVQALNKTPAQIALMALNAGNDQLLRLAQGSPATSQLDAMYNGVVQAVQSGQLAQSRVDDSVRRILHMKWWLGLVKNPYQDPTQVGRIVGSEAHLELAEQTSQDSMTLLSNANNLLPLDPKKTKNVFVTGWQINGALPSVDTVAQQIDAKGPQANAFPTGYAPTQAQIDQAVAKSQGNDVIVVLVYNVWQGAQLLSPQEQLVESLVHTGKPVIVIAQGTPYDAAYLPGVAAFLNAWNYHTTSLLTAADTLFGDVNPRGKLSVTITEPPPSTRVLYPFGFGLSYPG
ncbi:MAG TPA: glycoside hydrolase family 3 protein [Acidimicrobiales bacterium]|jgi:beta-N-acetylhexosaminidase|nr:glycoside hydrolase family 3 protein [Acidimicrobiales bacterium]